MSGQRNLKRQQRLRNLGPLSTCGCLAFSVAPALCPLGLWKVANGFCMERFLSPRSEVEKASSAHTRRTRT